MGTPTKADLVNTVHWALAGVGSGGLVVTWVAMDLVNLETGRAHQLNFFGAGISLSPKLTPSFSPSGSFSGDTALLSLTSYTEFRTSRPVNFKAFHGSSARFTSVDTPLYSASFLTVFDGPAYFSKPLAKVTQTGWGIALPGLTVGAHGLLHVMFDGLGKPMAPLGPVARHLYDSTLDVHRPTPPLSSVKLDAWEAPLFRVVGPRRP
jgi:hypothetical protein